VVDEVVALMQYLVYPTLLLEIAKSTKVVVPMQYSADPTSPLEGDAPHLVPMLKYFIGTRFPFSPIVTLC
jgi:hypothetical protein